MIPDFWPEFWRTLWREGRIGFHQSAPTPYLVAHAARLGLDEARVLVPFCGKSIDLLWLRDRAREVVGVELVHDAIEAFFAEHALEPTRRAFGDLVAYEAERITIVEGDFFALDPSRIGRFDVCFDRAAMVAVPASMRSAFVAKTRSLLAPGARTLLVTLEHDGPTDRPPFSIPEAAVRDAYPDDRVEVLDSTATSSSAALLGQRAGEHAFLITRAEDRAKP